MSDYVTLPQIKAGLPEEITASLLDDTGSGTADANVWVVVAAAVAREINGKLGQRYTLPLAEVPDLIANVAFVLAAELCYQRRGFYDDANPWTTRAKGVRKTLDALADGSQPLTPTTKKTNSPAVAITEAARLYPSSGNIMM